MLSYEIIMYATLGTLWGLFIWDRLGMFRCDHLMCPCTIHNPLYESDNDGDESDSENGESDEGDESDGEENDSE